jgi:threonine/homoserine/homoserine lactone efflux protein
VALEKADPKGRIPRNLSVSASVNPSVLYPNDISIRYIECTFNPKGQKIANRRAQIGYLYPMLAGVIPTRLPEYLVAAMIIIIAPGPSVLFVIARAVAWGRKISVLTVAGNVTGSFVLSTLVALGLGPILQKWHFTYIAVQWAGGLYLMYLGVDAIRKRAVHAADMTNQGPIAPTARQSIRDGFWVGVLNPKAIVFFAAVLPQFVDIDGGHVTIQLVFLGLVFCVLAFISDGSWGLLAGTARAWLATDNKRLERLRATGGCIMIILGVAVLISAVVTG